MRAVLSRHLSYANVVASLALFVALGGVSYAAVKLPSGSVGTKQIRKSAVTLSKIAPSARTALKGGTGPAGAPGAQGLPGAVGPSGVAGPAGVDGTKTIVARYASATLPANSYGNATAHCHPGERATGGGASIGGVHGEVTDSSPTGGTIVGGVMTNPTAWFGQGKTDATADTVNVAVICVSP
jgi:hypothetical protein